MTIFTITDPDDNTAWDVLEITKTNSEFTFTQLTFLIAPTGETTPTKQFRLMTINSIEDIPTPQ
ncbi:hypothetical protein [Neorhizobium sp. LjRoot104]|uniref:hypothetical protein n=1 Tax=Neorhizobium sp. LjRoot104 TaxID=3342254 RepID=UPI003ECD58CA